VVTVYDAVGHVVQVATEIAPCAVEYVFTEQAIQVVPPVILEYVPAGQNKQVLTLDAPMVVEYVPKAH
jgi:hypothetical protein